MGNRIVETVIEGSEPGWDIFNKIMPNLKKGQTFMLSGLKLPGVTDFINEIKNCKDCKEGKCKKHKK